MTTTDPGIEARVPGVLEPPSREAAEAARKEALGFLEKGLFVEALASYDSALSRAAETGDSAFVDWIFVCRATAAAESGAADSELVELKRILLRSGDPQTAFRAAYTGARIYELRHDLKKALFYNRIARQNAGRTGDVSLIGHSENQLGNLQTADSSFGDAAAAYERALASVHGDGSFPAVFRAVWSDNLGYCWLALDRIAEGIELVHGAFDSLESLNAKAYTAIPLLDLCFGYSKLDRYAEARYFGEEGLERAPLSGDPTVEKNLLYLLGEVCHLSGQAGAAEAYFDRLAAHYPEFRNLRSYLDVFDFRNVINLRG